MPNLDLAPRSFRYEDVADMLVSSCALCELDRSHALTIVPYMRPARAKAHVTLVEEGSENNHFMALILSGEVLVEKADPQHEQDMVLGTVGPGSLVGELGLVDGLPRSATVRTATEVDMAIMDRAALFLLMDKHPATAARLMAAMLSRLSNRLRATNRRVQLMHAINRALQEELDRTHGSFDAQGMHGSDTPGDAPSLSA